MNKNGECHENFIHILRHRTKWLHYKVVYITNTYIHKYINTHIQSEDCEITKSYTVQQPCMGRNYKLIQYTLLNVSMGD